jgi:uncharacterized membrane protein
MNYKLLVLSIILFPLIDYTYLSYISKHFSNVILKITKEPMVFNMPKAIGAYIFLILGLYYFILKNINDDNFKQKIMDAMILGWIIYGTYDFTNGAILKDYDWNTMLIDTVWGGILYGLVTYNVYKVSKFI